MENFLIVGAMLILVWTLVGLCWAAFLVIRFVVNLLGGGETPAAVRPVRAPTAASAQTRTAHAPTLPSSHAKLHSERKMSLGTVRFEVHRAYNLGLISRDTYLDMGRYVERERQSLAAPGSLDDAADLQPEYKPAIPLPLAPASQPAQPSSPLPLMPERLDVAPLPQPPHAPAAVETPIVTTIAIPIETPVETAATRRDPALIRAAIARLHEHASAPEIPDVAVAHSEAALQKEEPVELPDSTPHSEPSQAEDVSVPQHPLDSSAATPSSPVSPDPAVTPVRAAPPRIAPIPAPPKKPWAERLFTPENVRILQSLGICIIFISAVAFVRTQMWTDSSALTRLLILVAGTAACSGTGYALRRWLSLRITGLGFLILGQLSLILDAYSVLLEHGANGSALYSHSPASLWTVLFVIFTGMAALKARLLKEPLFDAFTYFGALAAWGAGGLWLGVDPYLLPATFVPALWISATLAQWIRPRSQPPLPESAESGTFTLRVPRWSLPWWLSTGFELGAVLLAVVLPIAAVLSGQKILAEHFAAHASALIGLAMSIFAVGALQQRRGDSRPLHLSVFHAAALLLLLPAPLAAYAFGWHAAAWAAAFALPGAALALAGLFFSRATAAKVLNTVSQWGLASTILGLSWALVAHLQGDASPACLWSAAAAGAVALAYAVVCEYAWAAWLSSACAAFVTVLAAAQLHVPSAWIPALAFGIALAGHAAWTVLKGKASAHGRWSCEAGAAFAAIQLVTFTPFSPAAGGGMHVASAVSAGWVACFAFVLASSLWNFNLLRRALGIALAAPAFAFVAYHCGWAFTAPAPYLALLGFAVIIGSQWIDERDGTVLGIAGILAHAGGLAAYAAFMHEYVTAAAAFALLTPALLVHAHFQRAHKEHERAVLSEVLGLGAFSVACACTFELLRWPAEVLPLAYSVAGAVLLVLARLRAASAGRDLPEIEQPCTLAAPLSALALSALALKTIVFTLFGTVSNPALLLTTIWISGLLPLYLGSRGKLFSDTREARTRPSIGPVTDVAAALLAALYWVLVVGRMAMAQFWNPLCPPPLRLACAVVLAVLVIMSAFALFRKQMVASVPAMVGAIGLLSCACAQWTLPTGSFELGCAFLALLTVPMERWLGRALSSEQQSPLAFEIALWIASLYSLCPMLLYLSHPTSLTIKLSQGLCVGAWLILACAWWQRSDRRRYTFLSVAAVTFAAAHALRWLGLGVEQFGPGIVGVALGTLVFAEIVRVLDWQRASDASDGAVPLSSTAKRANTMLLAAICVGIAGWICGAQSGAAGLMWQWSATLAECALFAAGLTVLLRRIHNFTGRALPVKTLLSIELAAWALLTHAIVALTSADAADLPLTGPVWVLIGALYLALGMAGEAIMGVVAGSKDTQKAPAFLESRHVAALALGGVGLCNAIFFKHAFEDPHALWRTLFSLAALAIYGSFARLSATERLTNWGRKISGGAAYIVLLPAGYLELLVAHSNHGCWAGAYFMLLVPVLLAAQYVLKRERRGDQVMLAQAGTVLVSAGALLLSLLANPQQLSAVPAVVLAAIALELLLMRALTGAREATAAACAAGFGAAYFAIQACVNFPIVGGLNPFAWQMPLLALLGLVTLLLGGIFKLEELPLQAKTPERAARGSLVAICGALLSVATLPVSILIVLSFGLRAHYPLWVNTEYLDALITCLMLLAATAIAASHWLADWKPVLATERYLAPAATLAAYLLFMLRHPPAAYEWYSIPAAVFIFGWAWQVVRDYEAVPAGVRPTSEPREIGLLLLVGSAIATLPSFIQELPHTTVATGHFFAMLAVSIALVFGAMLSRRKVPLLAGTAGLIIGTIVKAVQWAHHREGVVPLLGVLIGFALVGVSTLLESRMNQAFRKAVDRARAEARMFWVSWQ